MAAPRKQLVSLRGASAKEITRDALLERVSQERELRSYNRRVAAAALFIQRIWRRYHATKKVAGQLREEWESSVDCIDVPMTSTWVSSSLLRPFLFFVTFSSTLHNKLQITDTKCMLTCFKILLQSINSTEPKENFCSLAIGTFQEKNTWLYQARKLVSVCSSILVECDYFSSEGEDPALLTALSMRLIVSLTDLNVWKSFENENIRDASIAIKNLIRFVVTGKSGLYGCIRRYIMKLDAPIAARSKSHVQTDDCFLVTASAVTLALRPFQVSKLESDNVGLSVDFSGDEDNCLLDVKDAVEQYCIYLLTVPWLTERLPPVLLPALKHVSILSPCLKTLLISKEKIFIEMSNLDQSMTLGDHLEAVPSASWALANIISLATEFDNDCGDSRRFVDGLDCRLYIHAVNCISKNLMPWVDKVGQKLEVNDEELGSDHTSLVDLLKPVHQQWHLMRLLDFINESSFKEENVSLGKLELLDFVFFYSYMLRIFSSLNHIYGSLPILNTLSFTPAVLLKLWESLETSIFCENGYVTEADRKLFTGGCHGDEVLDKKERRFTKDSSNKWVSVLHKITGKSPMDVDSNPHLSSGLVDLARPDKDPSDLWDVKTLSRGPQGISNNISYLLHLFCATYAHLLTILDDIEFYEKQVPFTLERQRIIAAVLNTLVYNGFFHKNVHNNKPLMDAAVRCLHLLYERDCRHRFCPSSLWLAPARNSRPPIAVAARAHEAVSSNMRSGDALTITTIPHVFPFEERVQMFREFIKLDKVSRRIAGEVAGPGPGLVEIVVRRDHIVEDGFRQLNSLGSRLKSCINVSFVSECGLPEAGLDYGGLSKEFLTDISRKAFDPEYGLFSQTSTSERHLIPNTAARMVENGIQMIEFLGRVVGKALYEGILLNYSFSLVFIQKLLGRYSFLDELSTLDPELYRNLMYVKHYDGDVKELSLDFTVTEEILNKRVVTELKPGGSNVVVTNENKLQYVHAIADFKLNRQILPLANAFYRGLIDLISPSWLTLFNASEFNQLLSGGEHDFDVDDLRSNTRYTGGYSQGSRTIKLFWEVIAGFEPKERCLLLKFVTSCSRAPLLGFKHLQPTFTIHKVACDVPLWAMIGGQDVERLPSASTCYNTLKLPTYKRPSTMRNKLLYAVSSNAGFELS